MARKKELTTVYLEPGQLDALREISQRTRVPMAVIIREAIQARLDADACPATEPDPRQTEIGWITP